MMDPVNHDFSQKEKHLHDEGSGSARSTAVDFEKPLYMGSSLSSQSSLVPTLQNLLQKGDSVRRCPLRTPESGLHWEFRTQWAAVDRALWGKCSRSAGKCVAPTKQDQYLKVFLLSFLQVHGIFTGLPVPQYQRKSFKNPNVQKQILFCAFDTPILFIT